MNKTTYIIITYGMMFKYIWTKLFSYNLIIKEMKLKKM